MKNEYIVTNEYLQQLGLDLNDYALDGTCIPAIINIALYTILIPRICTLDDDIKSAEDIEKDLDKNPQKVETFLNAQYRTIYNLIFMNEENPLDPYLDSIIVFMLGWGKINGWQKGIYYKHNR